MLIFLNSKSIFNYPHSRWIFALAGLAWLGGCAFAPGLTIGRGITPAESTANPYSITTKRTAASLITSGSEGQIAADQTLTPGSLLAITPKLINQQRAMRKADVSDDVKSFFSEAKAYGIGPGDILNIVVWNHPELVLEKGYNVSPEGLIQFPLLGTFKIVGMSEIRAREELIRRLSKFLKDPQITVRIQDYRTGRVYVDGEVRTPGQQAINDIPMTLPEVISRAGGFTPTRKLAALAEWFGVRSAWHGPGDLCPLGHAASLHLDLNIHNFGIQESVNFNAATREVFPGTHTLKNGYAIINEAPGWGVDFDEQKAKKYPLPAQPGYWEPVRRRDGTAVRP